MGENRGCVQAAPIGIGLPTADREITIARALNGFIVRCGCKVVVFETKDKMILEISRYLDNPAEVEKEYLSKVK